MLKRLAKGLSLTAAMGMSMAAFAGGPDNYSQVVAPQDQSGFYASGNLGYSFTPSDSTSATGVITDPVNGNTISGTLTGELTDNSGFAARAAAGYAFNRYFAIEGGFIYLHPVTAEVTGTAAAGGTNAGQSMTISQQQNFYVLDLLAKGKYPMGRFFVTGGAGVAYVMKTYNDFNVYANNNFIGSVSGSTNVDGFFRPEVTAGVGYNVTQAMAVDLTYSRIFGEGKITDASNSYLPDLNSIMLGLTYKF